MSCNLWDPSEVKNLHCAGAVTQVCQSVVCDSVEQSTIQRPDPLAPYGPDPGSDGKQSIEGTWNCNPWDPFSCCAPTVAEAQIVSILRTDPSDDPWAVFAVYQTARVICVFRRARRVNNVCRPRACIIESQCLGI